MISIVTDSSAGYSSAELAKIGVNVVSLIYSCDGKIYEEKNRGENGDFTEIVACGRAKTSQPPLSAFVDVFSALVKKDREVLCILMSGGLSGTFASACSAAKQVGGKIRVIDSLTTNGGQHLLVDEAVNMVVGGLSLDAIAKNLEILRSKIGTVFSVDGIEDLVRGGRLSASQKPNTTLNTRPLFNLGGGIRFITNVRGQTARCKALADAVPDNARRIFVMRAGTEADITPLVNMLREKHPMKKIHLRDLGPVLSVHVGLGAFGVAYIVGTDLVGG